MHIHGFTLTMLNDLHFFLSEFLANLYKQCSSDARLPCKFLCGRDFKLFFNENKNHLINMNNQRLGLADALHQFHDILSGCKLGLFLLENHTDLTNETEKV